MSSDRQLMFAAHCHQMSFGYDVGRCDRMVSVQADQADLKEACRQADVQRTKMQLDAEALELRLFPHPHGSPSLPLPRLAWVMCELFFMCC